MLGIVPFLFILLRAPALSFTNFTINHFWNTFLHQLPAPPSGRKAHLGVFHINGIGIRPVKNLLWHHSHSVSGRVSHRIVPLKKSPSTCQPLQSIWYFWRNRVNSLLMQPTYRLPRYSSNFGKRVKTLPFTIPASRLSASNIFKAVAPRRLSLNSKDHIAETIVNIIAVKPREHALFKNQFQYQAASFLIKEILPKADKTGRKDEICLSICQVHFTSCSRLCQDT